MNASGELFSINREALQLRDDPGWQVDQTHAERCHVSHCNCAALMGSRHEYDPFNVRPWFKDNGISG